MIDVSDDETEINAGISRRGPPRPPRNTPLPRPLTTSPYLYQNMRTNVALSVRNLKVSLMDIYESFALNQHSTYSFFVNMIFRRFASSAESIELPRFDEVTPFTRPSFENHVNEMVRELETSMGKSIEHLKNVQAEEIEGNAAMFRSEIEALQFRLAYLESSRPEGQLHGYSCRVCIQPSRQFMALSGCGHMFCAQCIDRINDQQREKEARAAARGESVTRVRGVRCPMCRCESRAVKLFE